jgi:hypothetical protein
LETPQEWEWEQTAKAIRDKCEQDQFWPNFWFVSDHGNVSSLGLEIWPPPPPDVTGYWDKEASGELE